MDKAGLVPTTVVKRATHVSPLQGFATLVEVRVQKRAEFGCDDLIYIL
jgi:hypothetical protein